MSLSSVRSDSSFHTLSGGCPLSIEEAAEAQSFSKVRCEPSILLPTFPQVLGLRGQPSNLSRAALYEAAQWLEMGRTRRSSRTAQLISTVPEGAFLVFLWGYQYPLPTICVKHHHSFASGSHFISSLKDLHLRDHFSPGHAGGYLQPKSEAQGCWPAGMSPAQSSIRQPEAAAPGLPACSCQQREMPSHLRCLAVQTGQAVLPRCHSHSSGLSALPVRGAPTSRVFSLQLSASDFTTSEV